jgi:hemerythrin-like metal-binding protein
MNQPERYITGVFELDMDHFSLFTQMASINAMISANMLQGVLKEMQEFAHATVDHFNTEELLMQRYEYHGLESHRRRHKELSQKLAQLLEEPVFDHRTIAVIEEVLLDHIECFDQPLARFIKGERN